VSINENDPLPIYLQIVRQVKEQVLVGELSAGEELPSVRELGDALGISLHTARSAYQALSDAGLLRIRLGKRARIVNPGTIHDGPDAGQFVLRESAKELVIDALLCGMSSDEVRAMMDEEMEKLRLRSDEIGRGGQGEE